MHWLLSPPVFPSEERSHRARTFHRVALSTMVFASASMLVLAFTQPALRPRLAIYALCIDLGGFALLALNQRSHTRLASALLVGGLIALVTAMSLRAGGIHSPGVGMYLLLVLMATLLLGQRAGIAVGALCSLLGLGLAVVEELGMLPEQQTHHDALSSWIINVVYMGIVLVIMRFAASAVEQALQRAEDELTERHRVVLDLRERVKELRLLHEAARLLQPSRHFERAVLEQLVQLMPRAWLHVECCAARIVYRDLEVKTPGFQLSAWLQSESFSTSAGQGRVDVVYSRQQPRAAEGPFLAEERALLRSLVEMLVAYLEHQEAEQRRRELERQLRQAQKMEALGTLAGGIAHDFNNILMAIGFNVESVIAELPERSSERASLEQVMQAYERAVDLVKRILLFSRKEEPLRKAVALEPIIEEALALLNASLPMVQVNATYAGDLPEVFADASQLHQVIMNLGTNAGHAMPRGGVLSVDVSRVTIDDPAKAPAIELTPGTYLCVTVRDTGAGIRPEVIERIFEPFFTTKGTQGTGLGLSVVHGIVRDHQGAISVRSELGAGTCFQIHLPAATPGAQRAEARREAPLPGHGERVMCVDDEQPLVSVLERVLGRLGYAPVGFTEPTAALRTFRADPRAFDVVITDGAMPNMSGLQLARELRAIRPDIPIVLASAHAESAEGAAELGIALRLAKPPSVAELAQVLRLALEPAG